MKKALVTGANRSIGLEVVRQLSGLGYFVYLGCRDLSKGRAAAEGLSNVEALQIDTADPASIAAARGQVDSLDVLINNAGISGGFPQPPDATPVATIRTVFDTNFFGVIETTLAFLDLLRQSPEPRIVQVTSGLGSLTLHSDPASPFYHFKSGAYGPSKTALNGHTVALAYALRHTPFKVNVVDPGYTATEFNHFRGPGSVEGAAAIIVKYATIAEDGPTGKFFSNDYQDERGECPW